MSLSQQQCVPCKGGVDPMSPEEVGKYLRLLKTEWQSIDDKKIVKDFQFKNFTEAVAFVNSIAEVAEQQGHHPNLKIHDYKFVEVELYTHKINGLHVNDFILAANAEERYGA